MKKSKIAKIISILLIIILIIGLCCLLFLPNLYDIFKEVSVSSFASHSILYRIAFYICYIMCLFIVYKLIYLFNEIYKGSPFKKEIEMNLKVNAIIFMLLFIIVMCKSICIPTLLSFAVALVCFIASLSFYVLAEVIKAAITYKNEIDYTI